jgi:hypothetical protein
VNANVTSTHAKHNPLLNIETIWGVSYLEMVGNARTCSNLLENASKFSIRFETQGVTYMTVTGTVPAPYTQHVCSMYVYIYDDEKYHTLQQIIA